MKLGNYVHISISVKHLSESLPFYQKLGFTRLWTSEQPSPWVLLTDGVVNIHLFEREFLSPLLNYFAPDMSERTLHVRKLGVSFERRSSRDGTLIEDKFYDPNDIGIVLTHHDDREMPRPNGEPSSKCGIFSELSIATDDLERSITFWQQFGFTLLERSQVPHPWAILDDDLIVIGLHEDSTFVRTTLSYFAPDMRERIARLKKEGVPLAFEFNDKTGDASSGVIEAPDGQLFSLFTGEP